MNLFTLLLTLTTFHHHARAEPQPYFCGPFAVEAVTALTNVNYTVNESVFVTESSDGGRTFEVQAGEMGTGHDLYVVETSGGHDCVVLSVKAKNFPTRRP